MKTNRKYYQDIDDAWMAGQSFSQIVILDLIQTLIVSAMEDDSEIDTLSALNALNECILDNGIMDRTDAHGYIKAMIHSEDQALADLIGSTDAS